MRIPHRTPSLLVFAAAVCAGLAPAPARCELPPLVPREVFLGNPVKASARISPDGTRLTYLAPSTTNVLNVWLRTLGKNDDRMITNDTKRGIRIHLWAEDGKHVLYLQDVNGNENFHLYSVDLASNEAKDLTPHEGVRANDLLVDRKHPNEVLVGLNLRDKKLFDMHRIDLTTGESKLDTENPGDVQGWATDANFVIRAAQAQAPDGGTIIRVRDSATAPWRDLLSFSPEENGDFVDFTADGKQCYIESSIGSDVTRLIRVDAATGKEVAQIATDPRCDVGGVMVNDATHKIEAVGFNYLRNQWKVIDPTVAADFEALKKVHDGDFSIVSRDLADHTWIAAYTDDDGPVRFYSYDRASRKATFLFVNQPALETAQLAKREPVIITARDGVQLVSYLTCPFGVARKNLPLVLYVHGGPWARDSWGYDATAQWLANRGYAVLQVNFRASTGFGKKFLHLGDKQWGGTMQDDLTDATKWAIAQGIADPRRVGIMGGSYGGYATFAGLTFTPDLYACGVDIVGPSNLKTLIASIPPYWATIRKTFDIRMGDVDKDSLLNVKASPLFHVESIKVPLLIGQGQNDPRVNVRESEQIVAAMRAKNLPVEYVVYADEGHGFARPENRMDFYGRAEGFLAKHLGGRSEAFVEVKGAAAEVK
ncbi:MAG TPA: S9 family peptidase [Candidatus Eisenbacteria bacterium]